MIYIDTHKRYYSAIKINKLLLQSTTWMNLKITILSERSQAILNTYYICMWFQLYKTFIKYDFICIKFYTTNCLVTEWRSVVAWGQMSWERGEKLQPWVNFKERVDMFIILNVVTLSQVCTYTITYHLITGYSLFHVRYLNKNVINTMLNCETPGTLFKFDF